MKIYDKTTQTYKELVLKPGGDTLPIGGIIAFDSDTIPNGWLLCDGRAVSRTKYAELFKAIGTKHGSGDGSTTFNLPNPKGRTLVGKNSSDTDFNELGKTGGEKTHTITVDEMPSLTYDIQTADPNGSTPNGEYLGYGSNSDIKSRTYTSKITTNAGNQPHNNLQPYLVTNFIIKAKNTAVVKGDVIQEDGTASETNVYSSVAMDNKLKTNIVTGQEVATNEYIDGKRVYLKRATFTTPNAVDIWKTMITIPANSEIVNSYQVYEAESSKYPFPFSYNNESMQIYYNSNDGTINVKTSFNYSLNKDGYIIVKYTKN